METEEKRQKLDDKGFDDSCEASYEKSKEYWQAVPATVDGVLGGFGSISNTDISGSKSFLKPFITGPKALTGRNRAVDCGAGIGRITKHLLLPLFETVDLVEQNQSFLDNVREYVGTEAPRVGNLISSDLQSFKPSPDTYDVVWIQWVLNYLNDLEITDLFKNCAVSLRKNGLICVKENTSGSRDVEKDETDGGITRPAKLFRELMRKAGLKICKEKVQAKFPSELYEVRMFACRKA